MKMRSMAAAHAIVLMSLLSSLLIRHAPVQPAAAQAPTLHWTTLDAPGPAARWDHTLAADPATGSLLLFGGRDAAGAPLGDS